MTGWTAFWVVGLATPVAVYALDFWEHTLGLALMVWAVVLLLDVAGAARRLARRARRPARCSASAATMRTEALVYLVVATGLTCLVLLVRERAWLRPIVTGVCAVVGAGVILVANRLLEQSTIGTDVRTARVAGTASDAGAVADGPRARGADDRGRCRTSRAQAVGRGDDRRDRQSSRLRWGRGASAVPIAAALALGAALFAFGVVVYLVRFAQGWGFVPGLLVASPFAAVGLFLAWSKPALRLPAAIACVALPIVWYAQYQGGADPQWGGRYILLSGTLLAVAGCVVLRAHTRAFVAVVALAAITTLAGIGWLAVRSNTVADGHGDDRRPPRPGGDHPPDPLPP